MNHQTKRLILTQLILDKKYPTNFPLTDVVYLQEIKFLQVEIVEHFISNQTKIIFGFDVSNSLKSFLKKKLNNNFLYDLRKSGAIQLQF